MRVADRFGEPFAGCYGVRTSFDGTIFMVIEHNAEHRVEALHTLQRLGVADLPEVDLGVWDALLHNA